MSKANPTTIEELLGMSTDDIAKISDEELVAWCAQFWPDTRPSDVAKSALGREIDRSKDQLTKSDNRIAERLAALREQRAAATKANVVKLTPRK
jgi:hypothetical protein